MIWLLITQLWVNLAAPGDPALMKGNWQSCRSSETGEWAEAIVDFKKGQWHVREPFELHMGPQAEFALIPGIDREHHRDHTLAKRHWEIPWNAQGQKFRIPELHILFEVAPAGGSRDDCDSFFLSVSPLK